MEDHLQIGSGIDCTGLVEMVYQVHNSFIAFDCGGRLLSLQLPPLTIKGALIFR